MQPIVREFYVYQVERLPPGPLTLAVSVALIEKRRNRGAKRGEMVTAKDVVLALARELREGAIAQQVAQAQPGNTLAVLSPAVGVGFILGEMAYEGYLRSAVAYLPDEADEVENGPRLIVDVSKVDGARVCGAQA